jgi:uncharacterized protein (DUF2384 family)
MANVAYLERRPARAKRPPTAEAEASRDAFVALSRCFASHAQMQRALGWSAPTLRAWRTAPPARPRADRVERLWQMLNVARAAEEWVHDGDQSRVGAWLVAPNDALEGVAPATVVRCLGADGVERLLAGIHRIAPRTPVEESDLPTGRELAAELDRLGFPAPVRPAEAVDVDLSDFN